MEFAWMDTAAGDPAENLRLDEELLDKGRAVLRTWESDRECVVLGHAGRPDRDVHLDECERAKIAVLRRSSGGGAVVHQESKCGTWPST